MRRAALRYSAVLAIALAPPALTSHGSFAAPSVAPEAAEANAGTPSSQGRAPRGQSSKSLTLSAPIDCRPGVTCFVQSHVDRDEGPGAADFRCGNATYDGHKGVDFRVLSVAAASGGVAVLAAADGTVARRRDGVADSVTVDGVRSRGVADYAGRECGNGVVIEHGDRWETQYCHLRLGSVRVKPGQTVRRGEPIGLVGSSGKAEFAHVHLSVRHNGKVVDPYDGGTGAKACAADAAGTMADTPNGLWDAATRDAFPYRNGEIIGTGFAGETLTTERLERDHAVAPPAPNSPMLLLYGRVANMRQGDRLRIALSGPNGFSAVQTTAPVERAKAIYLGFAGKRRTAERWPAGRYTGTVELVRDGSVLMTSRAAELVLP